MKRIALRFHRSLAGIAFGHVGGAAWRSVCVAALALSITALVFGLWRSEQLQRKLETAEWDIANVAAQRANRTPVASPESRALDNRQVDALNQVTRQLNVPWSDIFVSIEDHAAAPVALVSIDPNSERHSVRIQAEAKELEALLGYAQQFQDSGPFGALTLIKHETNEQDPIHPVRLTFGAALSAAHAPSAGAIHAH